MTKDSRILSARLKNEVVDWYNEKIASGEVRASAVLNQTYELGRMLDLKPFKKACDEKRIDYQLAINRMVQLIRE